MKTRGTIVYSIIALAIFGASQGQAGEGKSHWGYEGHGGPAHWAELNEHYSACGKGTRQSPIDIVKHDAVKADMNGIKFDYAPTSPEVINNGHTIQANMKSGNFIEIAGKKYELLQFHFHTPSENIVAGQPYNMEMHLVHKNEQGQLAVVGVFMKNGRHNEVLQKIWSRMPEKAGGKAMLSDVAIKATDLLPVKQSYTHFNGSLTTPPCSEGVNWYVMDQPIEVSEAQIKKFTKVIGVNARPVQAKNDRFILTTM